MGPQRSKTFNVDPSNKTAAVTVSHGEQLLDVKRYGEMARVLRDPFYVGGWLLQMTYANTRSSLYNQPELLAYISSKAGLQLWFGDVEVTDPACNINEVRKKMGMVFQSFNLFGHRTVIENVMLPPMELLGKPKQEAYDEGMRLLRMVGLAEKALNYPVPLVRPPFIISPFSCVLCLF